MLLDLIINIIIRKTTDNIPLSVLLSHRIQPVTTINAEMEMPLSATAKLNKVEICGLYQEDRKISKRAEKVSGKPCWTPPLQN